MKNIEKWTKETVRKYEEQLEKAKEALSKENISFGSFCNLNHCNSCPFGENEELKTIYDCRRYFDSHKDEEVEQ